MSQFAEGTFLQDSMTLVGIMEDLALDPDGIKVKDIEDASFWQEIVSKCKKSSGGTIIEGKFSVPLSGWKDVTVITVIEEVGDWPVAYSQPSHPGKFMSLMTLRHWTRALLGECFVEWGKMPSHWVIINSSGTVVSRFYMGGPKISCF